MPLPSSVSYRLIHEFDVTIESEKSISGGSINDAYRISTHRGDLFLKCNTDVPNDFFEKEAEGLNLLRSAESGVRIPNVIAAEASSNGTPAFLLMEFIKTGRTGNSAQFGAELAKLHQTEDSEFGLNIDNYIGSLPQSNKKHTDWNSFFDEERISPQLKMAIDSGKMDVNVLSQWERLSSKLNKLLPETKPSLVHGDLWSGNYMFDESGNAVLIDPAVYYGHPEMDLAMSKMFGGFTGEFYSGYESVRPLEPGFSDRAQIYNLYPLMVHVNLFGGHYTSQATQLLKRFM